MSKIYNEIVIDMNPESPEFEQVLYEDSFEYNGDIALCHKWQKYTYDLGSNQRSWKDIQHTHDPEDPEDAEYTHKMDLRNIEGVAQGWFKQEYSAGNFTGKSKEEVWQMYMESPAYNEEDARISKETVYNDLLVGSGYPPHKKGIDDQEDGALKYDGFYASSQQMKFDAETQTWNPTGETRESTDEIYDRRKAENSSSYKYRHRYDNISTENKYHYKHDKQFDEWGNEVIDENEGRLMTVPYPEGHYLAGTGKQQVWQYRNGTWANSGADLEPPAHLKGNEDKERQWMEGVLKDVGSLEKAPEGLDATKMQLASDVASGNEELAEGDESLISHNNVPINFNNPNFMNATSDQTDSSQDANQTMTVNEDGETEEEGESESAEQDTGNIPPAPLDRGETWGAGSYGVDDFYDSETGKQYNEGQVIQNLMDKGVLKKDLSTDEIGKITRQIKDMGPKFSDYGATPEERQFAQEALSEDLYGIQEQAAKAAAPARNVYGGSGASMRQKMKQEKSISKSFSQAQQKHRRTTYDLERQGKEKYESELASFVDTNLDPWIKTDAKEGGFVWRDGSGVGRNRKPKGKSSETFLNALTKIPDAGGV